MDQGPIRRVEATYFTLATRTGQSTGSYRKNLTADVRYAITKCESLGPGQQLILYGNPSAIARDLSPHVPVPRRHFLPTVHFQGAPLENPLKTQWCEGLSCSPNQHFSTAFDPREWTMVEFWKEDSGRQLRLITRENQGGDDTSPPSPPTPTFFDDPDVPLGPPDTPPAPLGPPASPGLPPGLPPAPPHTGGENEQELNMYRVSDHDHDHNHQNLN